MRWQTVHYKRLSFDALERELKARVGVSGNTDDELIERLLRELLDAREVAEKARTMVTSDRQRTSDLTALHHALNDYYGEEIFDGNV